MGRGLGQQNLLPDQAAPGLISSVHEIFLDETFVAATKFNQRCCLEDSGLKR